MTLSFDRSPSMLGAYARALASRKRASGVRAEDVPVSTARLGPVVLDEAPLRAYRTVCGVDAAVPASYPQLLVTPVHVHLLTAPAFPLPAMGLVHPRCVVRQHRALRVGEALSLDAAITDCREAPNGLVFELTAEGLVGDERVWESRAETFARTGRGAAPKRDEPPEDWATDEPFSAPADVGRRYARVSGDANPVHLSALTARLFGYQRPIAHGWWLLARCLGMLGADGAESLALDLELRRPVFLPSTLRFVTRPDGEGTRFALLGDDDGKIRLCGRVER